MAVKAMPGALCACFLAACTPTDGPLDTSRLSDVFIQDFDSSDPAGCTTADVDLTHDEALSFFQRAKPLSAVQVADNYPLAPCKVEGTLRRDGQACEFEISAAMTGMIQCGDARWHFACDDCAALFVP